VFENLAWLRHWGRRGTIPRAALPPASQQYSGLTLRVTWGRPVAFAHRSTQEAEQVLDESGAAVRLSLRIGEAIEDAIVDHEERMHIPPVPNGPLEAIPFPDLSLSDAQVARARELMENGAGLYDAADAIGTPVSVLERHLAAYKPRWRRYLHDIESAV